MPNERGKRARTLSPAKPHRVRTRRSRNQRTEMMTARMVSRKLFFSGWKARLKYWIYRCTGVGGLSHSQPRVSHFDGNEITDTSDWISHRTSSYAKKYVNLNMRISKLWSIGSRDSPPSISSVQPSLHRSKPVTND